MGSISYLSSYLLLKRRRKFFLFSYFFFSASSASPTLSHASTKFTTIFFLQCYGGKPPEFLAKVPSGLLPVLQVDGQIITESAVIQGLLEQMYPEPALLPAEGTPERARASSLMRLERRLFSDWLQWLCNGWGGDGARAAFEATMDTIEKELGAVEGPYFLSEFSLIDIIFAPFLERVAASIPYYKGFVVRGQGRWANLERWFAAMETREPYLAFRSDYYSKFFFIYFIYFFSYISYISVSRHQFFFIFLKILFFLCSPLSRLAPSTGRMRLHPRIPPLRRSD